MTDQREGGEARRDEAREMREARERRDAGQPPGTPRDSTDPAPVDEVEEADQESFPASDAPGWTPLHPGPPAT